MHQSDACDGLRQQVGLMVPDGWQMTSELRTAQTSAVDVSAAVAVPEVLRSRTRARRRRRKRAWAAL
jgi:hypothetical protein